MSHANPMPIPSHSIGHIGHARDIHAPQIPCQSHQKSISVLCYIYPVYFYLPLLSRWGIPPPRLPPWYGRARPCARAERERGGSGAAAERLPTGTAGHTAQPHHTRAHTRHTRHTPRANCPPAATHPPPILHAALRAVACYTPRESLLHSTPGAAALRAVACYTPRESLLHSAPGAAALRAVARSTPRPPNCPSLSRGVPP